LALEKKLEKYLLTTGFKQHSVENFRLEVKEVCCRGE